MKLNLSSETIAHRIDATQVITTVEKSSRGSLKHAIIDVVTYDTRLIISGEKTLFFTLTGKLRSGNEYIADAYLKGVRSFVCDTIPSEIKQDCTYFIVKNTLESLQLLAISKRNEFSGTVIGITGSLGKTVFKEWAFTVLSKHHLVSKSPKSYNSQIGVAISILGANLNARYWLIEAGISEPNEMVSLEKMIQPTIGVLTHLAVSHAVGFDNFQHYCNEKSILYKNCDVVICPELEKNLLIQVKAPIHSVGLCQKNIVDIMHLTDAVSFANASLICGLLAALKLPIENYSEQFGLLEHLVMRLETYDGIHDTTIINDSYLLDEESFIEGLTYQKQIAGNRKRILILGNAGITAKQEAEFLSIGVDYKIDTIFSDENFDFNKASELIANSVILLKGKRIAKLEKLAQKLKARKHQTFLEINLSAIRKNIKYLTKDIPTGTKVLAMVKASGYGAGALELSTFLQENGIHYLGVAYADEGVELRNGGITIPILVLNAEEEAFEDIITFNLEPAIHSINHLEAFIATCIRMNIQNFPIQLKIETGMNRLGIDPKDVSSVISTILSQPEVRISGVYSHLAESDNTKNQSFTNKQITIFKETIHAIEHEISYPFLKHILNSEGITFFPEATFDMVRLGIGMYGYVSATEVRKHLTSAIRWVSTVSQVKKIYKGDSVSYSRTFIADDEMEIAVIPVGYADGFPRKLSNGVGSVFINKTECKVLGRVCMDMVMVDVTDMKIREGDLVEIIGEQFSMMDFSNRCGTIPYEVMTSFSKRIHRIYIEE